MWNAGAITQFGEAAGECVTVACSWQPQEAGGASAYHYTH